MQLLTLAKCKFVESKAIKKIDKSTTHIKRKNFKPNVYIRTIATQRPQEIQNLKIQSNRLMQKATNFPINNLKKLTQKNETIEH